MAGYLSWIVSATDNAIYPVLFLDYLLQIIGTNSENGDFMNPFLRFRLGNVGILRRLGTSTSRAASSSSGRTTHRSPTTTTKATPSIWTNMYKQHGERI
mmetsp:Transcript_7012/g.17297  ORF Transcript_7012/g.17297 Transcript_7012/m.17297 type:complete len:99 (-) Transcript_7012:163-459(-)